MKRILIASGLVLFLAAPAWAQDAKPNFSGTWILDLAKSDFGPMPPPDSLVLVIEHKEPNVKVSSTQKGPQGDVSNVRQLTTDGKENPNKLRTGEGEQEVKSRSQWNGKAFGTAYKMDVQGMTIDVSDSWELSADGKVLTISREIKTPQGDFTPKTVFNKK